MLSQEFDKNPDEFAKNFRVDSFRDEQCSEERPEDDEPRFIATTPLEPIGEEDEDSLTEPTSPFNKVDLYIIQVLLQNCLFYIYV